jgi:Multiubiquitin
MSDDATKKPIRIHIDRTPYEVNEHQLTGTQLRELPKPPIAADFDLWLEERGDVEDELVVPTETLKLKEDMHFYSAPTKINPGRC